MASHRDMFHAHAQRYHVNGGDGTQVGGAVGHNTGVVNATRVLAGNVNTANRRARGLFRVDIFTLSISTGSTRSTKAHQELRRSAWYAGGSSCVSP